MRNWIASQWWSKNELPTMELESEAHGVWVRMFLGYKVIPSWFIQSESTKDRIRNRLVSQNSQWARNYRLRTIHRELRNFHYSEAHRKRTHRSTTRISEYFRWLTSLS